MWQHDGIHFPKSSASNVIKAANPFLKKKNKKKTTKKQKWNSEDAFLTDTQQNNIKALSQVLFF